MSPRPGPAGAAVRRALSLLPPRTTDADLIEAAGDAFHCRLPDRVARRLAGSLRSGTPADEVVWWIAQSDERIASLVDDLAGHDDEAFVRALFLGLCDRGVDESGLAHYLGEAAAPGKGRTAVAASVARSGEAQHLDRLAKAKLLALPRIDHERPDLYVTKEAPEVPWPQRFLDTRPAGSMDWVDGRIAATGYYDLPNHWSTDLDDDKRTMAELLSAFAPEAGLEFGCSSGAVLEALLDLGIRAEGVDISPEAKAAANGRVRDAIVVADVLSADLPAGRDLVWGLDLFEHLHPGKLDAFLARVAASLAPGGFVVANVPALGPDPVLGQGIGPLDPRWEPENGRCQLLPVDALGFPVLGHLSWCSCAWWVERFEGAGLLRAPAIEAAMHARYDAWMLAASPARRTTFVFAKDPDPAHEAEVVERMQRGPQKGREPLN